jgi:hypothetical protein
MNMMMTEKMTKTTRDILLLRSSRESLRLFGVETLVKLFIMLLPDILAVRKLNRNPFYLFLRGNDRNCKGLERESSNLIFGSDFSIPRAKYATGF